MQGREFFEKCPQADTSDALFTLYRKAMLELGMNHVVYCTIRSTQDTKSIVSPFYCSYPEKWVDHYLRNDYMEIDPVRTQTLLSRRAFTWADMTAKTSLSKRQERVMNEGREAGLIDGVSLGFHGPKGDVMGVGLAASASNPDVDHFLTEIEVISTHFHFALLALRERNKTNSVQLNLREREVLKWIGAGKNDDEIGAILNISEHDIGRLISVIMQKLDADTRLSVTAKGLYSLSLQKIHEQH